MKAQQYKRILRSKEKELLKLLEARDGVTITEKMPDIMDEVLSSNDRDFVIDALARDAALLKLVRAALGRLDDGGYAICIRCGRRVPERRMKAVPWASMCIQCQEAVDRASSDANPGSELAAYQCAA